LLLYGSLRERSYSKLLTLEAQRLLKSLATKAASGQFFPNHSLSTGPISVTKQRRDAVVMDSQNESRPATRSPSPVSETRRETIARLRKNFKVDSS